MSGIYHIDISYEMPNDSAYILFVYLSAQLIELRSMPKIQQLAEIMMFTSLIPRFFSFPTLISSTLIQFIHLYRVFLK